MADKAESVAPDTFHAKLDSWTQTIALLGFGGLGVIAVLTFYDGAARYAGMPRIDGFSDYAQLSYAIVIASCFPMVLLRCNNITIRFLGRWLGARFYNWIETFGSLATLVFFTVIVWKFAELSADLQGSGRTTQTVEIPMAPWWWTATALMAVCLPVQGYVFFRNLRTTLNGGTIEVREQMTSET